MAPISFRLLRLLYGHQVLALPEQTARPDGPLVMFQGPAAPAQGRSIARLMERLSAEGVDATAVVCGNQDVVEGPCISARNPPETWRTVGAFFDHWRPDVVVWLGGPLQPLLQVEAVARKLPLYVFDAAGGSIAPTFARWIPGLTRTLLRSFDRITARDAVAARELRRLGAYPWRCSTTGPISEAPLTLAYDEASFARFAEGIGTRPVWLAAAVPEGEIAQVLDAHREAQRASHRLLLLLLGDTPETSLKSIAPAWDHGFRTGLMSQSGVPSATDDVYILEEPDALGLWYRLASITYLGGTMSEAANDDPLPPALLGSAVIHGDRVRDYGSEVARLNAARGTRAVRTGGTGGGLGGAVIDLLASDVAAEQSLCAWEALSAGAEATDMLTQLILSALEERA